MELSVQTLAFPLTNVYSRQIFEYFTGTTSIEIMYDSGAQMPVWCSGAEFLKKAYPNAHQTEYRCHISGFGKGTNGGDVYCIPGFCLTDDKACFRIDNLLLAVITKPFLGCDMLISETMFSKVDTYTARRTNRELKIIFDNVDRGYYCTPRKQGNLLIGISVWAQNE